MKEIIITNNDANRRLDKFLRKYLCNASLSQIYKIIRKDLKINGRRQNESYMLIDGDKLSFYLKDDEFDELSKKKSSQNIMHAKKQFDIVYEDKNILIVNKPFGLLTHGDSREKKNHLANQVKDYLIENGDYNPKNEKVFAPAPANRLDRNTTGLVIFGKNATSLKTFNAMIRDNMIRKYYLTIVHGNIKEKQTLSGILYKDAEKNKVQIVSNLDNDNGFEIKTIVKPIQHLKNNLTLVEVELITGRSHQIRAHLSSIGHPIIGDSKYATKTVNTANKALLEKHHLSTQLLHAYCLDIADATYSLAYLKNKKFYAELPVKFKDILTDFNGDYLQFSAN